MGALTTQHGSLFGISEWQPDVAQMLDEHHLAAWSREPRRRVHFAATLGHFLETQRDTEVVTFYGRHVTDLESFCYQLESALPGRPLERRIDGRHGVVGLLRERETFRFRAPPKFRYYLWHDADVLLKADADLFGRVVDAIAGVSAEQEYVSDDALMIQRAVLIGGPALDVYGENPAGQFRAWYDDGCGEAFWKVVTDLAGPRIKRFCVDGLY